MTDAERQAKVMDAAQALMTYIDGARISSRMRDRLCQLVGTVGESFGARVKGLKAEIKQQKAEIRRLKFERGLLPGPRS